MLVIFVSYLYHLNYPFFVVFFDRTIGPYLNEMGGNSNIFFLIFTAKLGVS